MGPATRQQALAKLSTFNRKIGYPDKWRDYPLTVSIELLTQGIKCAGGVRLQADLNKSKARGS